MHLPDWKDLMSPFLVIFQQSSVEQTRIKGIKFSLEPYIYFIAPHALHITQGNHIIINNSNCTSHALHSTRVRVREPPD